MNRTCFNQGMKEIEGFFEIQYPLPSLSQIWEEVKEFDDSAMVNAYKMITRNHLPNHKLTAGKVSDIICSCGKAIKLKVAKDREDDWSKEKAEEKQAATRFFRGMPPEVKERLQGLLGAW